MTSLLLCPLHNMLTSFTIGTGLERYSVASTVADISIQTVVLPKRT